MKIRGHLLLLLARGIAFVLLAAALPATAAASKAPGPAKAVTNTPPFQCEIPQSVFNVPSSRKEGRNPFFPLSTLGIEVPKPKDNNPVDFSNLVLNGITSPPKPTAMINGRTLERGEQAEVRLPSGAKLAIRCEEIKTDSVIVQVLVSGQRLELRLRSGV